MGRSSFPRAGSSGRFQDTALPLYGYRFLENNIEVYITRRYLGNSAWSKIIVGGSNFGKLFGSLFGSSLRLPFHERSPNAGLLLIVWYLATWYPSLNDRSFNSYGRQRVMSKLLLRK